MENLIHKKSYWPHGIIIGILLIILASVATIIVALNNPVEMDDFYLETYQDVDRNINTILKKQDEFFSKYSIKFKINDLKVQEKNNIFLVIYDKNDNTKIQNAKVLLSVTRPETNKYNQQFTLDKSQNGVFEIKDVFLAQPGRWQFKVKVNIGALQGFYEYEQNATHISNK